MVYDTLHQQSNGINDAFFSAGNTQALQVMLQQTVRAHTGANIDRQNDEDLLVIMRGVYGSSRTYMIKGKTVQEKVANLNTMVIDAVVPDVVARVRGLERYRKDLTSPLSPIAHAIATSSKGERSLEFPRERNMA